MSDSTRPESLLCKVALRFCLKYCMARANTLIAGKTWCLSSSIVVYLVRACHIRIHRGYSNVFVKYVFYFTSEVDNIYIS